jgi:hypothetical protein
MSGPAWTPKEISEFLRLDGIGIPAEGIACGLVHRTKSAVQSMRRKLKRLRELGASPAELQQLLAVNEAVVLASSLREIRKRADQVVVPVKHYLRRGRVTGRPHLVDEHVRAPVEKPE